MPLFSLTLSLENGGFLYSSACSKKKSCVIVRYTFLGQYRNVFTLRNFASIYIIDTISQSHGSFKIKKSTVLCMCFALFIDYRVCV